MTKKHIIFSVLVGGLVVLGAWLMLSMHIPAGTIVLREDGFHPRTLTVSVGEEITFKNASEKYFWPASDFHPTHALYPSFDALEPLAPGASYTYTFTEAGTYPFHDHLAAYFFGIIRVATADGEVPDDCGARGGNFACWQQELFTELVEQGLDSAYDLLTELYAEEPSFAGSCHSLTHNIGLASYQLYLEDPAMVRSPKAVACASGFYHGFMEGFIGASGDVVSAAGICDEVGTAVASSSPDARYQCYHGIGHGAMETAVASTGTLGSIDEVVDMAVRMCEDASEGTEERYRCVSGAYNAMANFYIVGAYGLSTNDGEAFALCARQPEVHKEACYGNMNSVAMWLASDEFLPATRYVLSMTDKEHIPKAIEYLAGMRALQHVRADAFPEVLADCRALPASYHVPCVAGIAHGLLEHGAPGTEYEAALEFCAFSALSSLERDMCYQKTLGELSGWYSDEKAIEICATVPPAFKSYCAP